MSLSQETEPEHILTYRHPAGGETDIWGRLDFETDPNNIVVHRRNGVFPIPRAWYLRHKLAPPPKKRSASA